MTNENLSEKRRMFLNMQDHPEKYTESQIKELLADEDIKAFAHQMAMTKRAMTHHTTQKADVNEAWRQFAKSYHTGTRHWPKIAATTAGIVFLSGIALAAVIRLGLFAPTPSPQQPATTVKTIPTTVADRATTQVDMPRDSTTMVPVTFENAELSTVLAQMGTYYHVDVVFKNEQARHIRLYFKWDRLQSLQHQTELLNTFDRINISLENNILTVE